MLTLNERLPQLIRDCQDAGPQSETQLELFNRIYEQTNRTIWKVLRSLVDEERALDLRQLVYLDIFQKIDRIDPGGNPLGWMCTLARHRAIDYLRAEDARKRGFLVPFDGDDDADRYAAGEGAPKKNRALERAFAALSPAEARVVDVYYAANNERAEAARLLKLSERQLKRIVTRLRRKLLSHAGVREFLGSGSGRPNPVKED